MAFGWLWYINEDSYMVKKKKVVTMSDVDNERHYACLGAVGIKEISIPSSWKLKTALKMNNW